MSPCGSIVSHLAALPARVIACGLSAQKTADGQSGMGQGQEDDLPADHIPLKSFVIVLDTLLFLVAPFSVLAVTSHTVSWACKTFPSYAKAPVCKATWLHVSVPTALFIYVAIEFLFFLWYLRKRARAMEDEQPLLAPSDHERERLVARVMESFESKEDARNFIQGWFHEATRYRWQGEGRVIGLEDLLADNVKELLSAAFFNETLEDVRAHPEHSKALDRYYRDIEHIIDYHFRPGYDKNIASIRQMIDTVPVEHRPFIFYAATMGAGWLVTGILRLAGFQRLRLIAPLVSAERRGRKKREGQAFEYFYSPQISKAKGLLASCWRRFSKPQANKTSNPTLPIVISAGLAGTTGCFHVALYLLWKSDRPVFLVGLPAVSLRLKEIGTRPRTASDIYYSEDDFGDHILWQPIGHRHEKVRPQIPTLDLQARGLRMMLDKHGDFGAGIFFSHSLGTSLLSFVARLDPQLVAAAIYCDPITFQIWHPRLVKTFLYKKPQVVGEYFIRLFSREIGISSVVSRAFFWHQVASFVKPADSTLNYEHDTVNTATTHVILSSEDALVPSRAIARRLARGGVRYTLLEGVHHAGFLASPNIFLRVMRIIEAEANRADRQTSPVLFSRPAFMRQDSATKSLSGRRSRAGSILSPILMTGMITEDPMAMARQSSRTSLSPMTAMEDSGVAGLRRRPSSVIGSSFVTSPRTP